MVKIKQNELVKIVNFFIIVLILLTVNNCNKSKIGKNREKYKFNQDWKFKQGDIVDAETVDFKDSKWRKLDLPHDWAIEGPFTREAYFGGGYLPYPGVGWYRKTFRIDKPDKNLRIQFDGVMRDAKVWLNGKYVGEWPYGYSSFSFDLTEYIEHGEENVLAVRVENEDFSSRWYPGSGIYRNVWLTITDPVHVEHWGTFVTTPQVTNEKATVNLKTWVLNNSNESSMVRLETSIIDSTGKKVSSVENRNKVERGDRYKFNQNLTVENPQRWDIKSPNIYKAVSEVYIGKEVVDRYVTTFGIRTFRFDPEQGFFLNGRNIKIKGVNLHSDYGPLGIAVHKRSIKRQLEIMKDMGVNAIRTAHNPPAPEKLELCDEMGILVMDETFDEWRVPKLERGYSRIFDEWAIKDTRALIKRDRNHPSVIMWSTGNEVYQLDTENGTKVGAKLSELCRKMDPSRPVSSGIHLSVELDQEVMDLFDVAGFNYWHKKVEEVHKNYPDKPLLVTESAAVLSTRGEYHFPVKRIYKKYKHNSLQISSYDLINTGFGALPDIEFKLQDDFEWLAGQFVWSGFDYHGEPDPYEDMWPAHSSYFGIVDMCGFPKDRYYLYKSQWTEEPMIHLLPHWNWEGREGEITPVFCYTNCFSAELFVNGVSQGLKQNKKREYRLKWNDVQYQPGSIKAVGYDEQGRKLCEKEIFTAQEANQIDLITDRKTIQADGEDMVFVAATIKDRKDQLCPNADNLVKFQIQGPGEILAVGNGDPTSLESYQSHQRKAFHGKCLVIVKSTGDRGKIELKATSSGLKSEKINILSE